MKNIITVTLLILISVHASAQKLNVSLFGGIGINGAIANDIVAKDIEYNVGNSSFTPTFGGNLFIEYKRVEIGVSGQIAYIKSKQSGFVQTSSFGKVEIYGNAELGKSSLLITPYINYVYNTKILSLYGGVNAGLFVTNSSKRLNNYKYDPTLTYGAQLGVSKNINKKLSLFAQIKSNIIFIKYDETTIPSQINFVDKRTTFASCTLGISYNIL